MRGAARAAAYAAWVAAASVERRRFMAATRDVRGTQERLLLSLVARNAGTEFGRAHGFERVRTFDDYRERVPLGDWADFEPFVEEAAAGRPAVLTAEPIRLFDPTGGSTRGTKLIPYTESLHAEFRRAIATWIADLYGTNRGLWRGRGYWQITPPVARERRTPGGTPIGFEDDAEYLGPLGRRALRLVLAVPPDVARGRDVEEFLRRTLVHLLCAPDLTLVSVWSPTFLTNLLDALPRLWPEIANAVAHRDSARAEVVAAVLDARQSAAEVTSALWPRLEVLSCWADGNAEPYARALANRFPQARLQPKGLIATEAFVSIPIASAAGAALALRSHAFEFECDGSATTRLAHELAVGERYCVVVTTGGGLYRYRLRDRVEVTGHLAECPLVRFVEKDDLVSDWFGEKISEAHAARAARAACGAAGVAPAFTLVSCEQIADGRAYTLFAESPPVAARRERVAAEVLEADLRGNFHYDYCRGLGQLAPARFVTVPHGAADRFDRHRAGSGRRLGDLKPAVLYPPGGVSAILLDLRQ